MLEGVGGDVVVAQLSLLIRLLSRKKVQSKSWIIDPFAAKTKWKKMSWKEFEKKIYEVYMIANCCYVCIKLTWLVVPNLCEIVEHTFQ